MVTSPKGNFPHIVTYTHKNTYRYSIEPQISKNGWKQPNCSPKEKWITQTWIPTQTLKSLKSTTNTDMQWVPTCVINRMIQSASQGMWHTRTRFGAYTRLQTKSPATGWNMASVGMESRVRERCHCTSSRVWFQRVQGVTLNIFYTFKLNTLGKNERSLPLGWGRGRTLLTHRWWITSTEE